MAGLRMHTTAEQASGRGASARGQKVLADAVSGGSVRNISKPVSDAFACVMAMRIPLEGLSQWWCDMRIFLLQMRFIHSSVYPPVHSSPKDQMANS